MKITELEIFGFKSFPEKTLLKFPEQITCIVGPNGSGKSNIVDAIRWVLGEQAFKQMRISETKELIFAGSDKYSPSNFALVRLTLESDNSDELAQLELIRKIYQDGNTEYYLNNQPVKLRELIKILAERQVGTKGLTIVNQGSADLFLKLSPQERYQSLLEMIGLRALEIKKAEAEQKLKLIAQKIKEAKIRLKEISPQLKYYQDIHQKLERKKTLEKEIQNLKKLFFSKKLFVLLEKEKTLKKEIDKLTQLKETKAKQLKKTEIKETFTDQTELSELRSKLISLLEEKEKYYQPKASSLPSPVEFLSQLVVKLKKILEIKEIKEIKSSLRLVIQSIERYFAPTFQKLNPNLEKVKQIEREINLTRKEIQQKEKELEEEKKDFQKRLAQFQIFQKEILETEIKIENLKKELAEIKRTINALQAQVSPQESKESELIELERKLTLLNQEFLSIGEINLELLKDLEKVVQRYQEIKKETEDLEASAKNIFQLIKELQKRIKNQSAKAVSLINENFHRYFRIFFGGGRAKILLKEKEIHLNIQHPEKKIKTLEAFSGGEKVLVSLSLLLAIIKTFAPPFVILDEVDASLDEENSQKLAKLIKELSQTTQFIIITHNRITIEIADVLYGVSMTEGVSKLFSLKLK